MSGPNHSFSQPMGPGEIDAMAGFIAALADIWGKGMSAWQTMTGAAPSLGPDRSTAQTADPVAAMLGPMANFAATLSAMLPRQIGPHAAAEASREAASQLGDLSPAMAEAGMIAVTSTLRYWRAMAEICARHQSSLMQAAMDRATDRSAASPAECRVLADELRGFLREIGDAATQEARRLQIELEQVGESIARATIQAEPPPYPEHRRRHRVKE
jgi:hypothetical protein